MIERKKEFFSLNEILNKEKAFKNFRKAIKEAEVIEKFYFIFPDLKKIAVPKKIKNKMLFLKVENSVWRNELRLKSNLMKKKINEYFNDIVVNAIKFIN